MILALSNLLGGIDFSTLALSGIAWLPLAVGTFVAANFAANHDRRSGIEDLLDVVSSAAPPARTNRWVGHNPRVTFHNQGYVLEAGVSLEDLDMGGGTLLALRVTGAESDGRVTVIEGVIHEGGPPLHVHDDEDEVIVVIEGRLAFRVGDVSGELGAGGLLWFPRDVPHAIAQAGPEPCRFITVVTPAGIEDFFRAQRDYLSSLPAGSSPDPALLGTVDGAATRRVVGSPIR